MRHSSNTYALVRSNRSATCGDSNFGGVLLLSAAANGYSSQRSGRPDLRRGGDSRCWGCHAWCWVVAVKPWLLRDSPGFQMIPEVNPLPSEAVFDKITMSAFEGTPLDIALRDCGIDAFAIVGIAMEIGIEPTVRHGANLGYIPMVVKDACGFGHRDAAARSIASLEFAGDALLTNVETICTQFRRILSQQAVVRA